MGYNIRFKFEDKPRSKRVFLATDYANVFCNVLIINKKESIENYISIGVNQAELEPDYIVTKSSILIFGIEQKIFSIFPNTGIIKQETTNITGVQSLEAFGDFYIASCEDSILCFDTNGEIIWRKNLPDIIEDVAEEDGILSIATMNGIILNIRIADGSPY